MITPHIRSQGRATIRSSAGTTGRPDSSAGLFARLPPPAPWMADGLCAQTDPEAFYPEKGGSTRDAKRICTGCPVRLECLQYALDRDEDYGVWGGLSARERRRLKRSAAA